MCLLRETVVLARFLVRFNIALEPRKMLCQHVVRTCVKQIKQGCNQKLYKTECRGSSYLCYNRNKCYFVCIKRVIDSLETQTDIFYLIY